jgi:DNA polymerase-3 subunit gamma/tau
LVFEDIVGQSHVATTLRNAIATQRLSHSYIFSGPRGVGKTTTARILAKAINCLHPKDFNPDNTCELCTEITEGRSVNVFEIDGASNRGVDEIRNLREAVRYGPAKGKYKVYIIDEVHMLTKEAFNALLKTLEEPPSYIVFIFATTEIHKVPLTILSRCQRFDFRRIGVDEIMARLRFIATEEKITIDDDALLLIAKRGDGSLRDAQSIFDQIVSFSGKKVSTKEIISLLNIVDEEMFFRATDLITAKDTKGGLQLVEEITEKGFDGREFLTGLTEHLRNLLVVAATGSSALIETSEVYKKRYLRDAQNFTEIDLLRLITLTADTESAMRWSQQPRYKLEIGLLQMIRLDRSVEIGQLLQQIEEIKKKNSNGLNTSSVRQDTPLPAIPRIETPVRGNVKASQPTLRPDQIVPSTILGAANVATESGSIYQRNISLPKTPVVQEPMIKLSLSEATEKWSVLVSEASKHRILVGTMLSEAALVDVKENSLCIACPDDFHLDALKRNRQFLLDLAQQVYGAKVRLETILSSSGQRSQPHLDQSTSHQQTVPTQTAASAQHPTVEAIIREFGAKVLE